MEGDIFPYTQVRWLSLRKWEILLFLDFCRWFIQALTSLPYLLWLYPRPTHTLQVHFSLQVYFHGLFRDSREFNLWSALLGPRNCSGVLSLFFLKFLIGSSFLSHSSFLFQMHNVYSITLIQNATNTFFTRKSHTFRRNLGFFFVCVHHIDHSYRKPLAVPKSNTRRKFRILHLQKALHFLCLRNFVIENLWFWENWLCYTVFGLIHLCALREKPSKF